MRVGVYDLWFRTGTKEKTKRYGLGSRWRVNFFVVNPDGTRRPATKGFTKRVDADEFAARVEHKLRDGSYREPAQDLKTFRDAAEDWFAGRHTPVGSSLSKYRDSLDVWVLPQWGHRKLSSITKAEVKGWIAALVEGSAPHAEGRRVRGGGLGPAAAKAVFVPFQASLAEAVELGWLVKNPATGVEMPKVIKETKVYLNFTELELLVTAAEAVGGNPSDAMAVALMGYCGLRPGEMAALRVKHVDLKTRRIKVRLTVTIDRFGKSIIGGPKAGELRDVPIAPHLVAPMRALIEGRPATDPLIASTQGEALNLANWRNRVWAKALAASGLDERGLVPQSLRHTAASMAIGSGADVKVVQAMLGHRDATVTLNTYADIWPDRLDEVSDAVSIARARALSSSSEKKQLLLNPY